MSEQVGAVNLDAILVDVVKHIAAYEAGNGPNLQAQDITAIREAGGDVATVEAMWAGAGTTMAAIGRSLRQRKLPAVWPPEAVPEPKPFIERFKVIDTSAAPKPILATKGVPKPTRPVAVAKLVERFKFHPSDKAGAGEVLPPTIDERDQLIGELADLKTTDAFAYETKARELARLLDVNLSTVEKQVKLELARRPKDTEQSQAMRVANLCRGPNVRLWHDEYGQGYASVRVDGHWENYRINSTAFSKWLRAEYGCRYRTKDGEPVAGSQALKDGAAQAEAWAGRGEEFVPALRVGGDNGEIWIDLGTSDWKAVHVTAEGWRIEPRSDVPFIRSANVRPLPEPARGGDFREIDKVLNVQREDLVLVFGWCLQAYNPEGSYPIISAEGESTNGKTTVCNMLLQLVDPNPTGLRTVKTENDLYIGAKNNHAVGFDNLSRMSETLADTLCKLATGIAIGSRQLYTNDEEFAFYARRPMLFNGIPADLTERSDLATRTIRLHILPIPEEKKRGDDELWTEFHEMGPRMFGAICDGLVAALRDRRTIKIGKKARMADFEAFAEAGCRTAFGEWTFVERYRENRRSSMQFAADADPIGRAVQAFMIDNHDGFTGSMSALLQKLSGKYRGSTLDRDWPKDATRLSPLYANNAGRLRTKASTF